MESDPDLSALEDLANGYRQLREQLAQVIVGQDEVIEQLFVCLLARGHALLVGVPGLAKTLLIRTLAEVLDLKFSRIQFTPDLMPSDITGTEVITEDKATGERVFRFLPGPIFANVVLADEINRTPPKTQAALLEAMQEYQVTVGGQRHPLDPPFFVLATQNPIEQEGTYPLPEAQLDRFMFNIFVDYPSEEEELLIVKRTTRDDLPKVSASMTAEQIMKYQHLVRRIPVADHVARYAMKLARATRPDRDEAPQLVRDYLRFGAGPRASQFLVLGAKARAALLGRHHATDEDVRAVAKPVMRHRLILHFSAEAEGISTDNVVERLLDQMSVGQGVPDLLEPAPGGKVE